MPSPFEQRNTSGLNERITQMLVENKPNLLATAIPNTTFITKATKIKSDLKTYKAIIIGQISSEVDSTQISARGNHYLGPLNEEFNPITDKSRVKDVIMLESPWRAPQGLKTLFENQIIALTDHRSASSQQECCGLTDPAQILTMGCRPSTMLTRSILTMKFGLAAGLTLGFEGTSGTHLRARSNSPFSPFSAPTDGRTRDMYPIGSWPISVKPIVSPHHLLRLPYTSLIEFSYSNTKGGASKDRSVTTAQVEAAAAAEAGGKGSPDIVEGRTARETTPRLGSVYKRRQPQHTKHKEPRKPPTSSVLQPTAKEAIQGKAAPTQGLLKKPANPSGKGPSIGAGQGSSISRLASLHHQMAAYNTKPALSSKCLMFSHVEIQDMKAMRSGPRIHSSPPSHSSPTSAAQTSVQDETHYQIINIT
ncbi:hypothetical protein FPV67DRAFT_1455400 [Lyophyllum atratum]|nr:hypothetical protein FPV67DRAFT_1455400 [Lyophyllum atratum]